jgi:hypothetical protein
VCKICEKFKTFWVNWSAIKFGNKLASPPQNSPQTKPSYKNINSNYGKICELDVSRFYLELNVCGLNLNVIQIQTKHQNYFQTIYKTLTSTRASFP